MGPCFPAVENLEQVGLSVNVFLELFLVNNVGPKHPACPFYMKFWNFFHDHF